MRERRMASKVRKEGLILLLLLFLGFSTQSRAQPEMAQDKPLADLAVLRLEITDSELAKEIVAYDPTSRSNSRLRVPDGFKLVVVTLGGTAPSWCPCVVSMQNSEFTAVFEHRIQTAGALLWPGIGSSWQMGPEGRGIVTYHVFGVQPGPVTLKVAFAIPDVVDTFLVRYPTLAKGKATVSGSKPTGAKR
jgi:hypothetical protein